MYRTVPTLALMLAVYGLSLMAQTPSTNATQEVHADLNQLMRGVLYPAANVVLVPGRVCSNGAPAPMKDPAWATFVQQVRDAGLMAYKAAQAKDQEKMIGLSETLSAACAGCHRKWRDRRTPA